MDVFSGGRRERGKSGGRRWRLPCCCVAAALVVAAAPPLPWDRGRRAEAREAPSQAAAAPLPVVVTILPQAYFMERIGGKHVEVSVLVGPGQSPHAYEPTPRQMAALAAARAYFLIGVPMEKAVLRKIGASHRKIGIVATQQGVPYRYLDGDGESHDHGGSDGGQRTASPRLPRAGTGKPCLQTAGGGTGKPAAPTRESGGVPPGGGGKSAARAAVAVPAGAGGRQPAPDPHIWLDPRLVKIQARNIHDALCRLDQAHQREYGANLQAFLEDLDRVDARIAQALAPLRGKKMYVFHPAFGYFAAAYGLIQTPVERGGREPGARRLASLIAAARRDGVKVIFVQAQFPARSAAAVAREIGGVVAPIDPLARDYLDNLNRIATAVERGLSR